MKWLTIPVIFFVFTIKAQDSLAIKYSTEIDADDLKRHLSVIASDEYAGRETGMICQKLTEKYLENAFKELGLAPGNNGSYLQYFDVVNYNPDADITIDGRKYDFYDQFYFYQKFENDINVDQLMFLGYGIDAPNYSDYQDVDVKGKFLIILEDEPLDKKDRSIITGTNEDSDWAYNWQKKYLTAVEKGAIGVITIVKDFENKVELIKDYQGSPKMSLLNDREPDEYSDSAPCIYISEKLGSQLLEKADLDYDDVIKHIAKKKTTITAEIDASIKIDFLPEGDLLKSSNVLGYLEGDSKKEEILVITAHYDHLGKQGDLIYNGADDDGSGTVGLLEIAQAFVAAKKNGHGPDRSILFMAVSGEEKGLLGSAYYSENPVYELDKTIANLNIDMIGRHDEYHENSNYVYVIGADRLSSELHEINENANKIYTALDLDYTYNEEDDPNQFYYRSDHYNFARKGIPAIFYFSGTHEDYHEPTDTVDKIEFDKMSTILKLIYFTAWDLVNRETRIKVDQPIDWN